MKKMAGKLIQEDEEQGKQTKEIQSILTCVKKFQDWKKVCEILMEKLFVNEVSARSNVSGTQGRLKLNDEKLEVLKGYLTEAFKVSESTVHEKIRQRCAFTFGER
ncbi:unnamed protein product, partial [Darwinula stevensoni]